MIRNRPKRKRSGAKRLDLTDMRHLFRDRRVWSALGVVIAPDEGGQHWQIVAHDGANVDITVEVELQPSLVHVTARLRGGMWEVPAVGDEVAVLVPEGEITFQPIIVAVLSSGTVPGGGAQAPAPNNIVIVPRNGGNVYIHDGSGGAEPLVKKSEFDGHTHGPGTYTTGSGSVTGVSGGAADVDGTSVLKAK